LGGGWPARAIGWARQRADVCARGRGPPPPRRDQAQRVGEPQLVEKITGGPVGARLAEKAAGIARRVDLLVLELPTHDADERAERRRHRQELGLPSGLPGWVLGASPPAVALVISPAQ